MKLWHWVLVAGGIGGLWWWSKKSGSTSSASVTNAISSMNAVLSPFGFAVVAAASGGYSLTDTLSGNVYATSSSLSTLRTAAIQQLNDAATTTELNALSLPT